MSQTQVNDAPGQAYAGKVQYSGQFPTTVVSRLAEELFFFGKLGVVTGAQLTVGDQSVKLPTSAAEVLLAAKAGGVSIADASIERLRDPANLGVANSAPFGAFPIESAVPLMRKGAVWVQTEVAVANLSDGVFVRVQNVGAIPLAALGSFTPVNTFDHEPGPEGMGWSGAVTIDGLFFGLLEINLPA